jgi:chemotaxis protein MotA
MNNLIFGLVAIIAVLVGSVEGSWAAYFQMHSIIIVFGGTAAILVFSTPAPVLKSLWLSLKEIYQKEPTISIYTSELNQLSLNRSQNIKSSNPLIHYAQDLWAQGIDPDLFIVLLSQKRKELESKKMDAVHALKNLAKYPPTLGMTGTVMGMISLFSSLDNNKGNVGSALSIAMTATLFGLVLANVFLSPVADRLHVNHVNQQRLMQNIYEILLLINQGEPTTLIKEELHDRSA